jgi:hypothetical protein
MRCNFAIILQLGLYFNRQLLAQFNAPLVKAVDVPDNALYKNFVFIHGNQRAETAGRYFFEKDRVSWPVALKLFKWRKLLNFIISFARFF